MHILVWMNIFQNKSAIAKCSLDDTWILDYTIHWVSNEDIFELFYHVNISYVCNVLG